MSQYTLISLLDKIILYFVKKSVIFDQDKWKQYFSKLFY